ncbi:MAG: ankyrin repeat domain-containing protein [Alphaproteobacteria bacterium]|jgi:ankyrin repeat protein|nr:ankyrin repeat domain-containing protein [Alphaproteobacteria bacterium]
MVRFIIVLWFVLVGSLSAAQIANASSKLEVPTIKQASQIEKNIRAGDWLVLDIDAILLVDLKGGGAAHNIDPHLSQMINLILQKNAQLPKGSESKKIRVIFLTARDSSLKEKTEEQLENIGIDPKGVELILNLNPSKELLTLYEAASIKPNRILVVDNRPEHLTAILEAFKGLPKMVLPYLMASTYRLFQSVSPEDTITFPETLDNLSYLEHLSGGSGGVFVLRDRSGQKFTLKCGQNIIHMKEEITADALYRSAGIKVPAFAVYDHLPNIQEVMAQCKGSALNRLAKFVEPGNQDKGTLTQQIRKGFVEDATFSNWDIIIGDFKNVVLDLHGVAWRVDNGGALRYKALGDRKMGTEGWDPNTVTELHTMRDPKISPPGSEVYGTLTDVDLKQQAANLLTKKNALFRTLDDLDAAIHLENPQELLEMLHHRLDDLMTRFKIQALPHRPVPQEKGFSLASAEEAVTDKSAAGILIYAQDPTTKKIMVLLGKRVGHNWWGNLGGGSEIGHGVPDKTLADTAAREVQEESMGLITYSSINLKTYPSHDLVNPDGVVYRMYIAPYNYVNANKIIEEPEVEEHHWKREYTKFKWVPLGNILDALAISKVFKEEDEDTIAVDGLILHPPLWHMLKSPPVVEALQRLNKGLVLQPPFWVKPKDSKNPKAKVFEAIRHTQGVDKTLTPITFAKTKEQLTEHVLRQGQVMAEMKKRGKFGVGSEASEKIETMKGVISKDQAQAVNQELKMIPLSQTEAHLVEVLPDKLPQSSAMQVEAFLKYDQKHPDYIKDTYYVKTLIDALETEKQHKDKIVFYHGTDPFVCFIYDFFTEYRAQLSALSPDTLKSLRILEKPFKNILDVEDFIQSFINSTGHVSNYGAAASSGIAYNTLGLSFNCFLFGSHQTAGSETYVYFYESKAVFGLGDFETSFKAFTPGLPLTFKNYLSLFNQYFRDTKNTKLVQAFIDPRVVDAVAYLAVSGGNVIKLKEPEGYHGFLKTIPVIRNNPKGALALFKDSVPPIENMDMLQARLFLKPEIFNRPELVQIHTYWRHPISLDQERTYKKKLSDLVAQDIKDALLKGSFKGSDFAEGKPALKKLHEQVQLGQLGIKPSSGIEKTPEENMSTALLAGDSVQIAQLLTDHPKMDFVKPVKVYLFDKSLGAERLRGTSPLYKLSPRDGVDILSWAVRNNKEDIIKLLVKDAPNLITDPQFANNQNGNTLLHQAVKEGSTAMVSLLLQEVPHLLDVSFVKNKEGDGPLHLAVKENNILMAQHLLKTAPQLLGDSLIKDKDGNTPLDLAIMEKKNDMVAFLLIHAPQMLTHRDCKKNKVSDALLVTKIAEMAISNTKNKQIEQALKKFLACASPQASNTTLKKLLENKSDEGKEIALLLLDNIKDKLDDTLVEAFLKNGDQELLGILFKKDINVKSVIQYATYNKKPEIVDLLLLKRKLTPDELDDGIHSALTNFTSQVLPKLLALNPTKTPNSDAYIDKNLQGYWGDIVFEDSIIGNQNVIFDFLYRRLKTIKNRYFILAIDSNNMHALEKLLAPEYLKRAGVLPDTRYKKIQKNTFTKEYVELDKEELDKANRASLSYWLEYIMDIAFTVHNTDVLDYIHKHFSSTLDKMPYWAIRSALQSGHDTKSILRFLKTNKDFADGLSLAAEHGDVELASDLLTKLKDTPEEPDALDRAQSQAIYHLKSPGQEKIHEMIWKRMKELKAPKLNSTIIAAIESDESSLDLLKKIVAEFKPNLNFVEGFVTPLIKAIVANDYPMVKYLLEQGADPNLPGASFTLGYPLSFAILEFIKYTPSSARGAKNYMNKYPGLKGPFSSNDTPNIDEHNAEMVKILIEHGADASRKIKDPEASTFVKVTVQDMAEIYSPGTIDYDNKEKKLNPKDLAWFDHLPPDRSEIFLETSKGNIYYRNNNGKFQKVSTTFINVAERHRLWKVVDELKRATGEGKENIHNKQINVGF